jgi:hypothetical protein
MNNTSNLRPLASLEGATINVAQINKKSRFKSKMNDFGNLNFNNADEINLNDNEAVAHAIVRVTRSRLGCQLSFTTAVSQAEKVITVATGPPVQQSQYMINMLERSMDNLDKRYAQLNATNQQLLLLDATQGNQIDWEEAIYDTNRLYNDIQNRIDMAMLAVTVPVANTLKHPPKAKSVIDPTPSIFDGSIENFSLAKFENLAPQQDVVSKLVNPVVVLESQIDINEECWAEHAKSTRSSRSSKISIEGDDESGKKYFILKLFATILVLFLCFVGGLVAVRNVLKSDEPIINCLNDTIGDGVCDDKQNIVECKYDGMDCCVRTSDRSICEVCECHLWKGQEDTTTTTTGTTTGSTTTTGTTTGSTITTGTTTGSTITTGFTKGRIMCQFLPAALSKASKIGHI